MDRKKNKDPDGMTAANKLRRSLWWYYSIALVLGLATYIVSMVIPRSAPATACYVDTTTVAQATYACVAGNLWEWGVKLVVWLVLSRGSNVFARRLLNLATDKELVQEMNTPNHNDSPAWINGVWYIVVAFMVSAVPYVSFESFLAFLLMRAAVTAVIAGIITQVLIMYRCRIRSTYEFVMLVQAKGTNSVAIWMLVGLISSVLLIK